MQPQPCLPSSYPHRAAKTFPPLSLSFYSSKFTHTTARTLSLHTEKSPAALCMSLPADGQEEE